MAVESTDLLGGGIPFCHHFHGRIGAAPGEHPVILGMERHALYRAGWVRQLFPQLPGVGVPNPDDPILTPRSQELAVPAERHRCREVGVTQGVYYLLARAD